MSVLQRFVSRSRNSVVGSETTTLAHWRDPDLECIYRKGAIKTQVRLGPISSSKELFRIPVTNGRRR